MGKGKMKSVEEKVPLVLALCKIIFTQLKQPSRPLNFNVVVEGSKEKSY
jgi:hypothetical protein